MSALHQRVDDGALWLTLDRPDTLNALDPEMSDELAAILESTIVRDDVRVVVLTGTGDAFSAGADLSGDSPQEKFDVTSLDRANRIIRAIVGLDKPVVAGVNGVAAGVGMAAALACDLQVARESALLAIGFAAIGLMPDGGSSATIGAAVGRARAMRLTLLAEPISARDAFDMGLISHCVGDEEYDEQLARVVRRLVRGAPLALAATKKAINAATLGHLGEALERERSGQTVLLRTADVAEGMAAFNAKRRPDFRGV